MNASEVIVLLQKGVKIKATSTLACSRCKTKRKVKVEAGMNAAREAADAYNEGWRTNGDSLPFCPKCVSAEGGTGNE